MFMVPETWSQRIRWQQGWGGLIWVPDISLCPHIVEWMRALSGSLLQEIWAYLWGLHSHNLLPIYMVNGSFMSNPFWFYGTTLWSCQAPLSMGFTRQEYCSVLPFPSPWDLPNPGIELKSLVSPALADVFFTTNNTWVLPSKGPPPKAITLVVKSSKDGLCWVAFQLSQSEFTIITKSSCYFPTKC